MLASMHRRSGPVIALALILALAIGAFALVVGASRQTETVLGPQITLEEPAGSPAPVASGPGRAASTASPPEGAGPRTSGGETSARSAASTTATSPASATSPATAASMAAATASTASDPAETRRRGGGSTRGRTLRAGAPGL